MDEFEEKCKRVFDMFDLDGDGQLTKAEIKRGYHMFEMCPTEEDLDQTMSALDIDNSGTVDLEDFKILMRKIDQEEEKANVADAFKKLDRRKRGYLDKKQFTVVLNGAMKGEAGGKFSKGEIDEFFKVVDTNGDGKIDCEEFVEAFTGETDVFASIRKPEYELKEEAENECQQQVKI
ncbi:neo-calmodulin-like [Pecten maximus]|uniref:neo-calmodulin-like n=1 Tax=Pecten maximus TaxID=6579 RepID=UPI001458255B|nr:neo-calmodulin-like [Pecten maximus]